MTTYVVVKGRVKVAKRLIYKPNIQNASPSMMTKLLLFCCTTHIVSISVINTDNHNTRSALFLCWSFYQFKMLFSKGMLVFVEYYFGDLNSVPNNKMRVYKKRNPVVVIKVQLMLIFQSSRSIHPCTKRSLRFVLVLMIKCTPIHMQEWNTFTRNGLLRVLSGIYILGIINFNG